MSGVGIICFAASYAVALALEVSRLLFRSSVRGAAMLAFAAAGLVAHTAYLYYRGVQAVGAPLSSEKDWYLLAAWALVAVYLYLSFYHAKVPFGLFLLPLALGLIATARYLADPQPLGEEPASRVWGAMHGMAVLLSAVAILLGFVSGLMYLGQARRLKSKRLPAGRLKLPSLEWLEAFNRRALIASAGLLAAGVAAGGILNTIQKHEHSNYLLWTDPVIISTWLMLLWLVLAALMAKFPRLSHHGRKVAFLTLASFIFLVIMLTAGLLMDSRHWGRGKNAEDKMQKADCRLPMDATIAADCRHSSCCIHHSAWDNVAAGGRPC